MTRFKKKKSDGTPKTFKELVKLMGYGYLYDPDPKSFKGRLYKVRRRLKRLISRKITKE